jgi:general secretion pathway protein I
MRRDTGFTLLEVLIAFVIAAMALSVMFKAATGGLFAVAIAGKYEEAVTRAKSHLAALGRDHPLAAGDFDGDDGDDYHWHLHIEQLAVVQPAEAMMRTIPRPMTKEPALYDAEVAISWTQSGRTRQVLLRSKRLDNQVSGNDG